MQIYKIDFFDNTKGIVVSDETRMIFKSKEYNFIFDKRSGFFVRWGETKDTDGNPLYGLPEIADIEIDNRCSGINGVPCSFCYKSNTQNGTYMTLEIFKLLFHKLPPTITQIAFGIGNIQNDELNTGNPDMWNIFDFCIQNGVVPNVTVNGEGITDDIADKLVSKCGAVAVSCYDKEKTYSTIKKLTDRGLKQVNIHFFLSKETLSKAYNVLNDIKNDDRLKNLNAIVFLSLKKKGRSINRFNSLSQDEFTELVKFSLDNEIGIGFDSCGCHKFLNSIKNNEKYKELVSYSDPCESSLYSSYFNVDAKFYPCSFIEDTEGWEDGIDVINSNDFLKDVWYNEKTIQFRNKLLKCNRNCPVYNI